MNRWKDWFPCSLVLLQLAGCLVPAALFAEPPFQVDVSEGEINGQTAVAFQVVKGLDSRDLVDPADFEVRLVPGSEPDRELVYPAGEWFQPPAGKYKLWLEGPGWITPFSSVMHYNPRPFNGKGMAGVVPVIPAGMLALDPAVEPTAAMVMRVLHLESHNQADFPLRELSRRVAGEAAHAGILMPVGPVLAAFFDNEAQEYVALSRPIDVKASAQARVRPTPPRDALTDLLVRLERPGFADKFSQYDVELFVREPGADAKPPDVFVPTADRIYAVWYALRGKYVTLEATSPSVNLFPQEIVLRPGKVETFYGSLRSLPDVDVRLDLPPMLPLPDSLSLEVILKTPSREKVKEATIPAHVGDFLLEDLPARNLDIVLNIPPWTFYQPVDLSDGADRTVYFSPVAIEVRGTVYRGDEGHPAVVEFETNRQHDILEVETDESGDYEAVLFRSGHYIVHVRLGNVAGPAYIELLDHPITEDTSLDFRIPGNTYRVYVMDSETKEAIPGAEVNAGNKYLSLGGGPVRESGREKTTVQRIVTDEDGIGELQPLHEGTLTLSARAEGYLPSDRLEQTVEKDVIEREITIALRGVEDATPVRLVLPNGLPAGGAEVSVQEALGNSLPLWSGRADSEGLVSLPRQPGGAHVLVRHPGGGWLVRRQPDTLGPTTWTLPAPAPLALEVERPWGDPARWAHLVLWIGEDRISGRTLAWLTGGSATNREGFWQAGNLPAKPLRILAWLPTDDLVSPVFEPRQAISLPYPWPENIEIKTLN